MTPGQAPVPMDERSLWRQCVETLGLASNWVASKLLDKIEPIEDET